MIPPLSNRLQACCSLVRPGGTVADVGCDHGYLGIYLLQQGLARRVYASDMRPMPLDSARKNAEKYGTAEHMTFTLCEGVRLVPRDFDTLVCAGMGADTIISILSDALWLRDSRYRLILQCQTRRQELRQWLSRNGYAILRETLAEDGAFIYPVMEVLWQPAPALTPGQCFVSPALLACTSPLLPEFFRRVRHGVAQTVEGLTVSASNPERLAHFRTVLSQLNEMEVQLYDNRK